MIRALFILVICLCPGYVRAKTDAVEPLEAAPLSTDPLAKPKPKRPAATPAKAARPVAKAPVRTPSKPVLQSKTPKAATPPVAKPVVPAKAPVQNAAAKVADAPDAAAPVAETPVPAAETAPPMMPEVAFVEGTTASADDVPEISAAEASAPAAETPASAETPERQVAQSGPPEEELPKFDQQGYLLRRAFDAEGKPVVAAPNLQGPARVYAPPGYQINQTGNNLELVTPWGRRLLFGDFGFNNARDYRLEIPLDALRPPEPPKKIDEQDALRLEHERAIAEAARAVKDAADAAKEAGAQRAPAQIPPRTVVEYDNTDRLVLEANRLYNRGKFYQASLTVEELLAKRPDFTRGWIMKGSLLYVQGYRDLAKIAWEKALELDPNNPEVKSFLGRLQ